MRALRVIKKSEYKANHLRVEKEDFEQLLKRAATPVKKRAKKIMKEKRKPYS